MMRVFKFGGALMNDAKGIRKVGEIIEEYSCEPLVVVVSAFGKTTNKIEGLLKLIADGESSDIVENAFFKLMQYHISIIHDLFNDNNHDLITEIKNLFNEFWETLNKDYPNRYIAYDQVVGFGEQFSALIVSAWTKSQGIKGDYIDATKIIVTDNNFTDAAVNWKLTKKTINARILPVVESNNIVVVQGFAAASESGDTTTLGREGSDFTAAIFANILNADELTIWKDVPGLMSADPKKFKDTVKLNSISYQEAIELAFYGASVIHPKTIQPLREKNIPLYVRSFFNPDSEPTLISSDKSTDETVPKIIVKEDQVLLSITSKNLDFISEEKLTYIFKVLSNNKIHLNIMQNSAVSFSVCFNKDNNKLNKLVADLSDQFYVRYNIGLQLLTLRHYNDGLIKEYVGGRKVYLEQKSRATVQLLIM
ncbi:MAG: aspartate kinase [Chlorobi bacterium]|nr:aspartate kinase [Chlorobiota bacterium]